MLKVLILSSLFSLQKSPDELAFSLLDQLFIRNLGRRVLELFVVLSVGGLRHSLRRRKKLVRIHDL